MSYQPHRSSLEHSQALAAILSRVGLTALLAFGALHAHAGPLTLDDALRVAQARSRQLPAQDAAAAAARDMAVAAGQRPDPVLKTGLFCLAGAPRCDGALGVQASGYGSIRVAQAACVACNVAVSSGSSKLLRPRPFGARSIAVSSPGQSGAPSLTLESQTDPLEPLHRI